MEGLVYAHPLIDSEQCIRMGRVHSEAGFPLNEGQAVGRIAIDLVGAGEHEAGVRGVEAGRFK